MGVKKKGCCLQISHCTCCSPIHYEPFWDTHGWGGWKVSLSCNCYTYARMIILGVVILHVKKTQQMYKSSYIFLEFCWPFFNQKLAIRFIMKFAVWYGFLIHLTFSESLYNAEINMIIILITSLKCATPDLLEEIKVLRFWLHDFCPWRHHRNFYHMFQIKLKMWLCERGLVTIAFPGEKLSQLHFCRNLTK